MYFYNIFKVSLLNYLKIYFNLFCYWWIDWV